MMERLTYRIRGREGFTLLELMIVVIVIGILASLALPRFNRAVERGRQAEALSNLGSLRTSQLRYSAEYVTLTTNLDDLDIENPNLFPVRYFNYTITDDGGGNFTITADRNTYRMPPTISDYQITIDQDGLITKSPGAP